jgi:N-acetylglucosaminyltransferase
MLILIQQLIASQLTLYIVFALFCWFLFTVRIWYMLRYQPNGAKITDPRVTVLIPTYHEDGDILSESIRRVLASRIDGHKVAEVIVIIDEREPEIRDWLQFNFPTVKVITAPPGKRWAVRRGIEAAIYNKVAIVESDTYLLTDCLQELIRPLEDPRVGGVVAFQRVWNPRENLCTRLMDWMENLKYRITVPGLSVNGVVNVLGGRCVVFRRDAIEPMLPQLTNEKFLGRICVSGDDGRVTSLLLEAGWRTIFQSTAHCYTVSPKTWRALIRQRLRWQRNSNRRVINAFRDGWLFRRHWTLGFQMFTTFAMPLFFGVIMVRTVQQVIILPFVQGDWQTGLIRLAIFIAGITITRAIRTFPHIADSKYDIPLLPLYALYLMFLMWPVRIWSYITMNRQGWMTRKVVSAGGLG